MEVVARHFESGRWTRLVVEEGRVASISDTVGSSNVEPSDEWVAPAFWDIQTNGRWGISFSSPDLTVEQVVEIVRAQRALGTARLCPTLITAPVAATKHGLRTIAAACESTPDVAAMIVGIHLEGPFLSEVDGYRGAHPLDAIRDPDWDLFREFQDEAHGRVILTTVAPERAGAMDFIRTAVASGVTVALGHTAADGPTLRAAVDAGATLSTHLGNGIASPLARHPNPIWEQAALDALSASLIADGHHLDPATLRVLVRAKTPARTILVSDASPLAGLPPGTYGAWGVDPSGKVVVSGTPYLAGAYRGLDFGIDALLKGTELTLGEVLATASRNPATLLGFPSPALEPGSIANLILFRHNPREGQRSFELSRSLIDGQWVPASDAPRNPLA